MELAFLIIKIIVLFVIIAALAYFTIDYLQYRKIVYKAISNNNTNIDGLNTKLSNTSNIVREEKEKNENKFNAFDNSLKDYFSFSSLDHAKLYDNTGSISNKNLELKAPLGTSHGVRINTVKNAKGANNLQICDDKNNCVHLHVNSDGFNITPNKLSSMSIKSESDKTIAKFDMKNNEIYIGGSDNRSPLFIQNNDVFIHNKSFNKMYNQINYELSNLKTDIDNVSEVIQPQLDNLYYIANNFEYENLKNKPMLFEGDYDSLYNKPNLFDGDYNSLNNKPTLFDGDYNSLTNKPTILDVQGDIVGGMLYQFGSIGTLRSRPKTWFHGKGSTSANVRVKGSSVILTVKSGSYYLPDIYVEFTKNATGFVQLEASYDGSITWSVVAEKKIYDTNSVFFGAVGIGKPN